MTYCRIGEDSDVYMYHSVSGGFQFHVRDEVGNFTYEYSSKTAGSAMLLLKHMKKIGYTVPDYAIKKLQDEIDSGMWDSTNN